MICSLRDVHYSYHRGSPVLEGVNVDFSEGEVVVVCGRNGAGKSTLLNIIALDKIPTNGSITVFGEVAAGAGTVLVRRKIGMLAQTPFIFSGTVMDNITLGLRFHRVARQLRKDVAIEELRRFGLEQLADVSAVQLSGGQKQRLALARILVLRPQILLLDEPFTYLDAEMVERCTDILRNLDAHGLRLVVFTTHDNNHTDMAHALVHLAQGMATTERLR